MQLDLFKNIAKEMQKIEINQFLQELVERLTKMEEEYVIDRFEGSIAICEERKTGKKKEILKEELPEGIKEGSVLKEENGKYVKAENEQEEIEKRIESKMNKLWKD